MKKIDLQQEVYDLYDYYVHNRIDRREFVDSLGAYAVGGLTVPAILDYLLPNYQDRQQIKQDDERLKTETITYDSPKGGGEMKAQLSMSKDASGKLPGVL